VISLSPERNFQKILKTEEECSEAEKKRVSDPQAVKPYKTVKIQDLSECHSCQKGKAPDSYPHQKGSYRQPVPVKMRRTAEREQGLGWPGLCCDEEGFYVGGLFNSCLMEGTPCTYHAAARGRRRRED